MATSIEQFVQQLVGTGLMSAEEVSAFQKSFAPDKAPKDAETLGRELVQAKKLTKYQAAAVLHAKTKWLVFDEYVVVDKLGQGGMGVVLKAEHRKMRRLVAVKLILSQALKNPEAVQRFYREVQAAAKLAHPNIVTAYDAREQYGYPFLIMEYIDGRDLGALVQEHGPMPVQQAVECILQAARGLQYAHNHGVIHRDIKPANIMLDKEGVVKILDLGLARLATSFGTATASGSDRLTQSGQIMGTCDYMAPEQAEDTHRADHRSDVYSLGCTFFRLLTGKPPYAGDSLMVVLLAHRQNPIPSLCKARADVPPELDAVFRKMVAKRPEDRHQSMAEVVADLEAFLAAKQPRAGNEAAEPSSVVTNVGVWLQGLSQAAPLAPEAAASPARGDVTSWLESLSQGEPAARHQETVALQAERETGSKAGLPSLLSGRGRPRFLLAVAGAVTGIAVLLGLWLAFSGRSKPQTEEAAPQVLKEAGPSAPADSSAQRTPKRWKPGARATPQPVNVAPEPIPLAPGAPLSNSALVTNPAAIQGLRSWTIETVGHRGAVTAAAFAPDAPSLATACDPGVVRLWESTTGKLTRVLIGHEATIPGLSWSPDGKYLASASHDKTIGLWDARSGRLLRRLAGHSAEVRAVAWSPEGQRLASASCDGTVRLWGVASGQLLGALSGHAGPVQCVAWSPDGTSLVSGGDDRTVRLWNATSGQLRQPPMDAKDKVYAIAWSPDGSWVAYTASDEIPAPSRVQVWNVEKDEWLDEPWVLPSSMGPVGWLAGGTRLALAPGLDDDKVRVRDFSANQVHEPVTLQKPGWVDIPTLASSMSCSSDGKTLAVGANYGVAHLCDLESGRVSRVLPANSTLIRTAALSAAVQVWDCRAKAGRDLPASPSGDLSISSDGHWRGAPGVEKEFVYVAQTDLGQDTLTPEEFAAKYAWRNDPDRLLLSGKALPRPAPAAVEIRPEPAKLPDGAPLSSLALVQRPAAIPGVRSWSVETIGHRGPALSVAHSPTGRVLATGCSDGAIRLWDVNTGRLIKALLGHDGEVSSLSWSPDGRCLASGSHDKTIRFWDARGGALLRTVRHDAAKVLAVAWSPDGRTLASGNADNTIYLWDLTSDNRVRILNGHLNRVLAVAWSPDGKTLASGGDDKTCRLWDAQSGQLRFTLEHPVRVPQVVWSPDGKRVAAGSDVTVRLWDPETGTLAVGLGPSTVGPRPLVTWSPDGRIRAAAGEWTNNNRLWTWTLVFPSPLADSPLLPKGMGAGCSLESSADGKSVAMGGDTGLVQLWDHPSGQPTHLLPAHTSSVLCLAFSPDGNTLASGNLDGTTRLWTTDSGGLRCQIDRPCDAVTFVRLITWSPDGKLVATWSILEGVSAVRVFEARKFLREIRPEAWPASDGKGIAWSPDGKLLATGDGTIAAWDAASGQQVQKFFGNGRAVAWSADGKSLTVAVDKEINLCDPTTGAATESLSGVETPLRALDWSPEGKTLAAGGDDKRVYLWDRDAKQPPKKLAVAHQSPITLLQWLDDGKTLLSGSSTEVCVWEKESGKLLRTITGDGGACLPQARLLASRGASLIRLRNLDDGQVVRTIVSLRNEQYAAVGSDGHLRISTDAETEFVYVVQTDKGQDTLAPDEFSKLYGWRNDPDKLRSKRTDSGGKPPVLKPADGEKSASPPEKPETRAAKPGG